MCVAAAGRQKSEATATFSPAASNPAVRPPAPQKRSMTFKARLPWGSSPLWIANAVRPAFRDRLVALRRSTVGVKRDKLPHLHRDLFHCVLARAQAAAGREQGTDIAQLLIGRVMHDGDQQVADQ